MKLPTNDLHVHTEAWPSPVGGKDSISLEMEGQGYDQGIGQAESSAMPRSKLRGPDRDLAGDRLDIGRQVEEEVVNRLQRITATARRPHLSLCVGRCRDGERIAAFGGVHHRPPGLLVVRIVGVKDADDHARVENGQRHSSRSSSSSPG